MSEIQSHMGDPQEKMEKAVDNYLALSKILRADLEWLLNLDSDTPEWRRNFVRCASAFVEGNIFAIREMCAVSELCDHAPTLTKKEEEALDPGERLSADKSFKFVLSAAHKLFDVMPGPNFGTQDWPNAQRFIRLRNKLMHPKCPEDLEFSNETWDQAYNGAIWMLEQIFDFAARLHTRAPKAPAHL